MSSQLKIESNRRNAQLSTGPTTPGGKAKVATNSRTHGLCSRRIQRAAGGSPRGIPARQRPREVARPRVGLRRIVRLETGIFVSAMEKVREYEKCCNTARPGTLAAAIGYSQPAA
jgi:hypothetical protein